MGTHPIFESDFDCLTEWTVLKNKQIEPIVNLEQAEGPKRKRIKLYPETRKMTFQNLINRKRQRKNEIQKHLPFIQLSQCEKCSIEVKTKRQVCQHQWSYCQNQKNHHQLSSRLSDHQKLASQP